MSRDNCISCAVSDVRACSNCTYYFSSNFTAYLRIQWKRLIDRVWGLYMTEKEWLLPLSIIILLVDYKFSSYMLRDLTMISVTY